MSYVRRLGPDFSGFSVHIIRVDGTHDRQLTPHAMEAANADWAPDASRLAFNDNFTEPCSGLSDIFVMTPDGDHITSLTSGFGCNTFPNWSPDGHKLLFDHVDAPFTGFSDIYVINADGSGRINLTHSPGVDRVPLRLAGRLMTNAKIDTTGRPLPAHTAAASVLGALLILACSAAAARADTAQRALGQPRKRRGDAGPVSVTG